MGLLKSLLGVAVAKKAYETTQRRPIITPPEGFVVRELTHKGFGSNWVVRYSRKTSMNSTAIFDVSPTTRKVHIGPDTWHIDWP